MRGRRSRAGSKRSLARGSAAAHAVRGHRTTACINDTPIDGRQRRDDDLHDESAFKDAALKIVELNPEPWYAINWRESFLARAQ